MDSFQALTVSGDTDNAHYYMKRAAKHLKMSEPEYCCHAYMAFLFNLMYLKLLRISKKSMYVGFISIHYL